MKYKIHLIALPIFAILAFLTYSAFVPVQTPVANAAFGISPPWVKSEYALPGTTITQTINLSSSNTDRDMKVTARYTGDKKLKKWITIENEDNIIMKKGQTRIQVNFRVDIPKRAGIRHYSGDMALRLEPLVKEQTSGVAIALGANVDIDIEVVGDEVIDFKISSASIDPITEGEPLGVNLRVSNLGNINLDNIKIVTDIWSNDRSEEHTSELQSH